MQVSFECLQTIVESEIWRREPRYLSWILTEYTKLAALYPEEAQNFGTSEFWTAALDEDPQGEERIQTGKF